MIPRKAQLPMAARGKSPRVQVALEDLAQRVDALELSVNTTMQQWEDAKDVEKVEAKMKQMALVKKAEEADEGVRRVEAKLQHQICMLQDALNSDLDTIKRDWRLSLERFRDCTNRVLADLHAHVDGQAEKLSKQIASTNSKVEENFLASHSRLLVLEEESQSLRDSNVDGQDALLRMQKQLESNSTSIKQLHSEIGHIAGQMQSVLSLVSRNLQQQK